MQYRYEYRRYFFTYFGNIQYQYVLSSGALVNSVDNNTERVKTRTVVLSKLNIATVLTYQHHVIVNYSDFAISRQQSLY